MTDNLLQCSLKATIKNEYTNTAYHQGTTPESYRSCTATIRRPEVPTILNYGMSLTVFLPLAF